MISNRCWTFVRSASVGVAATATDLVTLTLLVDALHVHVRKASIAALAAGIVVQFVGNKLLAFENRSPRWIHQGAQFLGVEVFGFATNVIVYDLAIRTAHLPYLPLRLLTTSAVYFCVCLPLWSRIFGRDVEAPFSLREL